MVLLLLYVGVANESIKYYYYHPWIQANYEMN